MRDIWSKDLKFAGTVFILFDSSSDAKSAKNCLQNYDLHGDLENTDDSDGFHPSEWIVRFAPPSSDIIWENVAHQSLRSRCIPIKFIAQLWDCLMPILLSICFYFVYINLMTAPGIFFRYMHSIGNTGRDDFSMFFKTFILPNIISFLTSFLTDLVSEWVENKKKHLTHSELRSAVFSSTCILQIILYLYRMLAIKPLPLLLISLLADNTANDEPIRWECIFFPEHVSFIICAIIANTTSAILMSHSRIKFLWDIFVHKLWHKRTESEYRVFRNTYRAEFDFKMAYAEIVTNFILTIWFMPVYPIIGLVSFVFLTIRFYSDRSALSSIYDRSEDNCHLNHGPINMIILMLLGAPLPLFAYRFIQINNTVNFYDASLLPPFLVFVGYGLYLVFHCRVVLKHRLNKWWKWVSPRLCIQQHALSEIHVEEDDEELTDISDFRDDYDLVKKITQKPTLKCIP